MGKGFLYPHFLIKNLQKAVHSNLIEKGEEMKKDHWVDARFLWVIVAAEKGEKSQLWVGIFVGEILEPSFPKKNVLFILLVPKNKREKNMTFAKGGRASYCLWNCTVLQNELKISIVLYKRFVFSTQLHPFQVAIKRENNLELMRNAHQHFEVLKSENGRITPKRLW